MKTILEYISTQTKPSTIKATDETIHQIIRDEFERLGPEADLNHIDVSKVTFMKGLFDAQEGNILTIPPHLKLTVTANSRDTSSFNGYRRFEIFNGDISKWNVSKVKDMCCMFHRCKSFNCDISNWDVSNVMDLAYMFDGCTDFNQDLSNWNINLNARVGTAMFRDCGIQNSYRPK